MLLLARDRIGKKPLYWFQSKNYFIFASELKGILATGAVPQTPALDSLAAYLYFGYTPQDMSPIKDVNKLLPGYFLQLNRDGSKNIQSYWSYSSYFRKKQPSNSADAIIQFEELMHQSIQECIPEDRPFGCFIGGGLGSACIANSLRKILPANQIKAFTVEFQGQNSDDTYAAKEIAAALRLKHQCEMITPKNFLDDFVKMAWHLDEPIGNPTVIATWRLAKAAQPMGTLFSGMGSDELLAGHSRYTIEEKSNDPLTTLLLASMPYIQRYLLPILKIVHKPAAFAILQKSRTNPEQVSYLIQNALFADTIRSAAAPNIAHLFDPYIFLHKFHNLPNIPSLVSSYLYLDVKTRLPDHYILQYERIMSAHSIEWRAPFLTEPLVEFLAGLPEPDMLEGSKTFSILKSLMKNSFSSEVLNRPKKTRKNFLQPWAEYTELSHLFKLLQHGALVESGLISGKWLSAQLATPATRRASFRYLWSLLSLEVWYQLFINRPILSHPPEITIRQLLTDGIK